MKTTLTVRLDARRARLLAEASRRLGRSASDIVRDALDVALTERTIAERAGFAKGRIALAGRSASPWGRRLRERNWRP
jgi:hypothetical protein